jgi:hypothetical protein
MCIFYRSGIGKWGKRPGIPVFLQEFIADWPCRLEKPAFLQFYSCAKELSEKGNGVKASPEFGMKKAFNDRCKRG